MTDNIEKATELTTMKITGRESYDELNQFSVPEKFREDEEFLIERRLHPMWIHTEWVMQKDPEYRARMNELKSEHSIGKYQYLVSSKNKKWIAIKESHPVSIVELPNYFMGGHTLWECCRTISRHDTLDEAIEQAKDFLRTEIKTRKIIKEW